MDSAPDKVIAPPLFKKSKRRGTSLRKRAGNDGHESGADDKDFMATEEAAQITKGRDATDARAPSQTQQPSISALDTAAGDNKGADPAQYRDASAAGDAQSVVYHYRPAMDATRTAEYDAPALTTSRDSHRPQDYNADAAQPVDVKPGESLYKGKKGYSSRLPTSDVAKKVGPFKAPTNVRSTSVFDYQPNLCKDYKETGYCGYGDSCIFLHDRSNTKTGWQLEKEFEEAQHGVKRGNRRLWPVDSDSEEDGDKCRKKKDSSEELPFACLICRNPFTKPVVTKCKHYFCEACALAQYRKTPKCFACGAATAGTFKQAKDILAAINGGSQNVKAA